MAKQDVVSSKRTSGRKTKKSSKVQTDTRPKAERWEKWEIERLRRYMLGFLKDNLLGSVKWNTIPYKADLQGTKTFKQCRERWKNHEDPNINKEEWTAEEDESLVGLYYETPNRWAHIKNCLGTRRSDHTVKNRFNSLRKKGKIKQLLKKFEARNDMQSATVSAAAGAAAAQAAHKLGRTRSSSSTSSNSGNGNNNSGGAAYFAAPFFTHRAGKVPAKARLDQYTAEDTEMLSVGNSKTCNRATTATTKDYAGFSLTSSSCRAASVAPTDSKPKTCASAEYGSLIRTDAELAFAQWNAKELKVSPPESPPFDFIPGDVYKDGKDDHGVAPRASKRLANLRNLASGIEPPPAMFPMLSSSDILEQHGFYDATVFHPGMRLLSGLSDCTMEQLSGKSSRTTSDELALTMTHESPDNVV